MFDVKKIKLYILKILIANKIFFFIHKIKYISRYMIEYKYCLTMLYFGRNISSKFQKNKNMTI